MPRHYLPWIAPLVLLAVALSSAFFLPLLMIMSIALALVTFFGALAGGTQGAQPRGMANTVVAISLLLVPLRAGINLLKGEVIEWRHELLVFGFTTLLVAAFLLNRHVARRSRARGSTKEP